MGSEDRTLLKSLGSGLSSLRPLKGCLLSKVPSADTTVVSSNMGTPTHILAASPVGQVKFSAWNRQSVSPRSHVRRPCSESPLWYAVESKCFPLNSHVEG